MTIIELESRENRLADDAPQWVAQIDTNCGYAEPDWEDNTHPKPLAEALDESAELREQGWITRVKMAD